MPPPTVAWPTVAYNVGFPNDPMDVAPTYTDLAGDIETLTIQRGRQSEDEQAQTGTCTVALADTTRKYDPNNAAGTYYPNVQPMKPVQVVFTLDGIPYAKHTGWVDLQDGWVRDESDPGRALVGVLSNDAFELIGVSRLTARDSFGVLLGLGSTFDPKTTGLRIVDVLAGWTSAFLVDQGMDPPWPWTTAGIADGLEPLPAISGSNEDTPPLDLIREAETTEPGFFFFAGDGGARFLDRRARSLTTSAATFCDKLSFSAGRIPYKSVTTRRSSLVNDARTTRAGGTLQQQDDPASILALGRRARSWATQHVTDAAAQIFNAWQLNSRSTSYELLESLTLNPGTDYATWLQILTRELGDRITVVRKPQGVGATITQDYIIEGLSITWGPGASASCTWRLSSAAAGQMWAAGVVGASEAGTTTKAGY